MAYTTHNFKTKKALKEAVAHWVSRYDHDHMAKSVQCYNPGLGPDLSNYTGSISLEGPHYPKPHKWYARAELRDGIVIKVD